MQEKIQHLHGPSSGWPARVYLQKEYADRRVVVNRVGKVNLIHLDRPSQETIRRRVRSVMEEELSGGLPPAVCPLCRGCHDHAYDVLYYDSED